MTSSQNEVMVGDIVATKKQIVGMVERISDQGICQIVRRVHFVPKRISANAKNLTVIYGTGSIAAESWRNSQKL